MNTSRTAALAAALLFLARASWGQPAPEPPPAPTAPPSSTGAAATAPPEPAPPDASSPPAPPTYGYPPYNDPGAVPAPYGYPYPYAPPYGAAPPEPPPATLPYTKGTTVPFGYHEETRIRHKLVLWGAITFGSIYSLIAIGVSTALLDGEDNAKDRELAPLFIPVAGPFIVLGTTSEEKGKPGLVIGGLIQTAGVSMLVAGLVARETIFVRNEPRQARPYRPEVLVGFKAASLRWRF